MAQLGGERPFAPGEYPVLVVGSGPGSIQVSHSLRSRGVAHAVISRDEEPGGMFRRFPLFQRLVTWTKPYAPAERRTRAYQWYDWNSLIAGDPENESLVAEHMDGTSYFPARSEMEAGIRAFVGRAGLPIRYGCTWESTRAEDGGFLVTTSDGEYRCRFLVVGVGMTEPWRPDIPGLEAAAHYVDVSDPNAYAGQTVFVVGKRNSGFEVADGLLPWARSIVLASPRPARISVLVRSTAAARARYLQPYEDHVLAGGTFVIDAAIERVERTEDGFLVHAHGSTGGGRRVFSVDSVIAATGFTTPMGDLPELGVTTFYQGRLPAQTPYWESASVPGIFFVGSITQGSLGMKKYGIPSNSAAVHGFRYNAMVLADHIGLKLGKAAQARRLQAGEVIPFLIEEADGAPELWNQQSYLARVLRFDPGEGIVDLGIQPLQHFVDDDDATDAVALAIETDGSGDTHPAVYVRQNGRMREHRLPGDMLNEFAGREHRDELAAALEGLV